MVDKRILQGHPLLKWIGIYLILDGVISFIYFQNTALPTEQFFRVIRTLLGVYLVRW